MSEETPELAALTHRAAWPMAVCSVAACFLTAFREEGVWFLVGAVAAWLLALLFGGAVLEHRWDVCSYCDAPPRRIATAEGRARLARRVHGRVTGRVMGITMLVLIVYIVMPKPYMEHVTGWWRLIPAGAYALIALVTMAAIRRSALHKTHQDECHVEWCRAGRTKTRVPNARQRVTAHYAIWILLVLIPGTVALGAVALERTGLQVAYGGALLLDVYILAVAIKWHTETPCLICAVRFPTDAVAVAEKRKPWLRLHHVLGVTGWVCVSVVWVASWLGAGTVYGRAALGAAGLCVIGMMALSRAHGRVQPWCPWCRDDDGDEAGADTPDPSTMQPAPA